MGNPLKKFVFLKKNHRSQKVYLVVVETVLPGELDGYEVDSIFRKRRMAERRVVEIKQSKTYDENRTVVFIHEMKLL